MPQSYSPVDFPQDWSPISMSASNQFTDAPSDDADNDIGNYATWNPLDQQYSGFTYAEGNKRISTGVSSGGQTTSTMALGSGRYYAEVLINSWASSNGVGIAKPGEPNNGSVNVHLQHVIVGKIYNNGVENQTGLPTLSATNVVGIDLDIDGGTVQFYLNDSTYGSAESLTAGEGYAIFAQSGGNTADVTIRTDPADWSYSAKGTGVSFCTANLPAPTVTDSSEFFKAVTFSGTGGAQNVDTIGFRPDLLIIKSVTSAANFNWVDAVRGASELLWSNASVAQSEQTTSVTGFRDAGFSVGSDSGGYVNISGQTMIAYGLKAGGATTSSNTDGTITSEVTAASHGGFSIAKYTGTGANATFGHGCSRAPKFILVRAYEQGYSWTAWHEGLTTGDYIIYIDGAAAESNQFGGAWQSTPPSSSVVTLGSQTGQNGSGQVHVCYSFARTPGLIGIGSYTGNGSSDGRAVVVNDGASGFKPAWLMIRSTASGNWNIVDATRDTYNPVGDGLRVNSSIAEFSGQTMDFLANGFKLRLSGSDYNTSSQKYIYLAMAENPFGGSGIAQARAR